MFHNFLDYYKICSNPCFNMCNRHHDKKDIEFYAEKVSGNIVVMNDQREYEMIKARTGLNATEDDSFTGQSPAPTPELIINSDHNCMRCLKPKLSISFTKDKKMTFGRTK